MNISKTFRPYLNLRLLVFLGNNNLHIYGVREVAGFDRPPLTGPRLMLVHDRPLVHLNDGFGGRRAIAQSTVRSLRVVVFPPLFDDNLSLLQRVEDFTV